MNIEKKYFGNCAEGAVDMYTMSVDSGMSVSIITFGGAIVKLLAPNKSGRLADVVCGYDDISSYLEGNGYHGAIIGRFGNRIAKGKFTLDGKEYDLYINNGENHLHGGKQGFSHKIWDANAYVENDACVLDLSYTSPDGEENYPGTLDVNVKYRLSQDNSLAIEYSAKTDKKTILNLTNHTYFNLGGYASGKVFDHVLKMDVESFVEAGAGLIPTGRLVSVDGNAFDFREEKTIGKDFDLSYEPLKIAGGYDHCLNFAEREDPMAEPRIIARDPKSDREMHVYTDAPCVQLYTANFMNNEKYPFKGGFPQEIQNAFCLETQRMPDSINHDNFTNCILNPDEDFKTTTKFKFITK